MGLRDNLSKRFIALLLDPPWRKSKAEDLAQLQYHLSEMQGWIDSLDKLRATNEIDEDNSLFRGDAKSFSRGCLDEARLYLNSSPRLTKCQKYEFDNKRRRLEQRYEWTFK